MLSQNSHHTTVVRTATAASAAVWATYAIIESVFVVFGPLARILAATLFPSSFPAYNRTYISPSMTAFVLCLYPVAGALLGLVSAIIVTSIPRLCRALEAADWRWFWTAVAMLELTVVFGANGFLVRQAAAVLATILPLVLIAIALRRIGSSRQADRWSTVTAPVTVLALLIGGAFFLQPRPYASLAIQLAAFVFYIGSVLAVAFWIGRKLRPLRPGPVTLIAASVAVLMCSIGVAAVPGGIHRARSATGGAPDTNVILITMDTVRADHLSVYGYVRDTSPNLRRFAAGATLYTNAVSASNWTLPSHASLLTGVWTWRHGAHEAVDQPGVVFPIASNIALLPQLLARRGYDTAAVVANFVVLLPEFGFARGFNAYTDSGIEDFFTVTTRPYLLRESVRYAAASLSSPRRRELLYVSAEMLTRRAMPFLAQEAHDRRPFFLFLNFMDAHAPYLPPPPFDTLYPGKDPAFRWSGYVKLRDAVMWDHTHSITSSEFRHLTSQYDGGIAYLDEQLGKFLSRLKELGLYDDALIIVTSDHGEAFGESSIVNHGVTLYQHQIHVPLLIKYPRQRTAATVTMPVSGVDVAPTILDIAGLRVPAYVDGRSLRNPPTQRPYVMSESYGPRRRGVPRHDTGPVEIALVADGFKEILWANGSREIYDLKNDPAESRNLAASVADPATWAEALHDYLRAARTQGHGSSVTDPEILKRLRAVGYIH